jgi:hypothetical protein
MPSSVKGSRILARTRLVVVIDGGRIRGLRKRLGLAVGSQQGSDDLFVQDQQSGKSPKVLGKQFV